MSLKVEDRYIKSFINENEVEYLKENIELCHKQLEEKNYLKCQTQKKRLIMMMRLQD